MVKNIKETKDTFDYASHKNSETKEAMPGTPHKRSNYNSPDKKLPHNRNTKILTCGEETSVKEREILD